MPDVKACFRCKSIKPISEFSLCRAKPDGRQSMCGVCRREYHKQYRDHDNARNRDWYERNKARRKQSMYEWETRCSGTRNAISARRRAAKAQATPSWLTSQDYFQMRCLYEAAKIFQPYCDDRLEIDHIVPLISEEVCGLHVPWNLQILPRRVNRKKSNKLRF